MEESTKELLFFEPVLIELIWGREIWGISAHEHGDCTVSEGIYKGMKLSALWHEHRELFGDLPGECFPLIVKRIEAEDDLSIQVHPDDSYAKKYESGALGKTECWYVLDCKPDQTIIIGHHAKTSQEAEQMIRENRWSELLREIPVHKGDFFQITPGTIHSIKSGTTIMEIQQSSDITYRLYDYDRLKDGKPRELHLQQSIDVIRSPYRIPASYQGDDRTVLTQCPYFTVHHYNIEEKQQFVQDHAFEIVIVLKGQGEAEGHSICGGDSFIVPTEYGPYSISGNLEILITVV